MSFLKLPVCVLTLIFSTTLATAALPTPKRIESMIERTQRGLLDKNELSTLRRQADGEVIKNLSEYLLNESKDTEKRWFAAILLGRLGGPEALDRLTLGLSHEQFFVRLAAIKGLELIRNPISINALHQRLFDSAMVVRAAAADAVGRFSRRESIKHLERGLFHKDNFIKGRSLWARKNFVYAIGTIGGADSMRSLLKCLRESDAMMHKAALNSLNPILESGVPIQDSEIKSLRKAWLHWWDSKNQKPIEPEPVEATSKDLPPQASSEAEAGDN